jgi:hypothetical protein
MGSTMLKGFENVDALSYRHLCCDDIAIQLGHVDVRPLLSPFFLTNSSNGNEKINISLLDPSVGTVVVSRRERVKHEVGGRELGVPIILYMIPES